MSQKTVRTCDICGQDQAQTNGWWAYWTADNTFHVAHAVDVPMWEGLSHACGQLCVHKALDAYFAAQVIPSPVVKEDVPETPLSTKEPPESPFKGKGLTVESLVAEQGGKPEEAVYEGFVESSCDEGESCRVVDAEKEFENTKPGEPEKAE